MIRARMQLLGIGMALSSRSLEARVRCLTKSAILLGQQCNILWSGVKLKSEDQAPLASLPKQPEPSQISQEKRWNEQACMAVN